MLQGVFRARFKKSFSQSGEDLIVKYIFDQKGIKHPSYIDIGAHDPNFINNTKLFYDSGSRGINIEPNPDYYKKLLSDRKRDINLNVRITNKSHGVPKFYVLSSPSLSTFSEGTANKLVKKYGYKISQILEVNTLTIIEVISKYWKSRFPDFLSLDTEGFEDAIIHSINFRRSIPKVICLETISYSLSGKGKKNDKLINYICGQKYMLYADTNINTIFVNKNFWMNKKV